MKKPSYLVKNSYDDYDVTYIGNIDKNEEDMAFFIFFIPQF